MEVRHGNEAVRLGFAIAKILLKAAGVAAAFCIVSEVHNVHKSIERRYEGK